MGRISKDTLNIAVIGGGERFDLLLARFQKHAFQEIHAAVVAVFDSGDESSALMKAQELGIFVTKDLKEILHLKDVDLIVDLTGDENISQRITQEKRKAVHLISWQGARLLWEFLLSDDLLEKTQESLARTKTLYEAAINAFFHEDVMLIGRDYRILDINDTMLKKIGLTRDSVLGMHCYELSHGRDKPCDGKEHPCPLTDCLSTGKASQTTHIHRDRQDNPCYYSISCYPIFTNNEAEGAVEISKDITKDILLQKKLVEQQKLASVGQLAAGVAHEINNPLTTILTTAMLLQEDMDEDDPNYQELETISKETLRCRKIVTSLLDFARQSKPVKALHDISGIIRESMALTRKQAAFKDVNFESLLSEDLPLIHVDKDQIQQCLINLVLNGIEATDSGGTIIFTSRMIPERGEIEITVSDTGRGIPENASDRVFEPFFTTKQSGTGLGLAITHGIIQQHGGTIDVKSKPGKGTTFGIHLPIRKGEEDAG
ncbi:MAG: PAS domain-containing protein [Deltaproteobacteria bacterium]|nr:PAS domain-containing protein [Deltaproteobacteria bacterium]